MVSKSERRRTIDLCTGGCDWRTKGSSGGGGGGELRRSEGCLMVVVVQYNGVSV